MKKIIKSVTKGLTLHSKELLFWGTSTLIFLAVAYTALFLSSQVLPNYREENSFHFSAPRIEAGFIETISPVREIGSPTEEIVLDLIEPIPFKEEKSNDALDTVKTYFFAYNSEDFKKACELLDPAKCNPESPYAVNRLADEYHKMSNGYENWNFWMAENTDDFHSDVVCVKYSYHYKDDVKNKQIHERLSFYVRKDENGNDHIYARVCEKKFAQGVGDLPCPILSKRDFCLD